MILKALYDYYHRRGDLPAYGLEEKEIGFLIVIDSEGRFLRFEDRRLDKKSAQKFLVRKSVVRTAAPKANFLYDNSQYVFGYSDKGGLDKMRKYFDAFRARVEAICQAAPDHSDLRAVRLFYTQEPEAILEALQADPLWSDVAGNLNKKFSNFTFLLEGATEPVACQCDLVSLLPDSAGDDGDATWRRCLVTGERGPVVELTNPAPILGSKTNAKLVAFQTSSGYDSYGRVKCGNAPISPEAEFAYTAAIKALSDPASRNKFMVGDRTFVFWASSSSDAAQAAEQSLFAFLGRGEADDPDRGIEHVRQTFKAIYNGQLPTTQDERFYILGMAPNAARIAVVYWAELPLGDFAKRISRHFEDMDITDTRPNARPHASLHAILRAVTPIKSSGTMGDVTPNLPDALVRSIFQGLPYPATLYQSCLRRIRAEGSKKDQKGRPIDPVLTARAAILKACLNRNPDSLNLPLKPMLDRQNHNAGYLCGRLFAVLDKIQEDANRIHSLRERYLNAASSTPATVFSTLLNLSAHHLEKLNGGTQVYYERLKQEIISGLSADGFPVHLDLQDQGRFFVGYYHQRQDLFTAREDRAEA